jgi:hypothetical protein
MDEIDKNIAAYEKAQGELEKADTGKWVLFHRSKQVGIYGSFEDAAEEAVKKFGAGPYLIRQVGAPSLTLPVSVVRN